MIIIMIYEVLYAHTLQIKYLWQGFKDVKLQKPEIHMMAFVALDQYLPYAGIDKEESSTKFPGLKEMERFSGSLSDYENNFQNACKNKHEISRFC